VANQIVINGPLKLVQGNFGTIARIPIFISNATANETWGVAAVGGYSAGRRVLDCGRAM
jgi:sensor domain CHASE-containing protein